MLLGEKEKSGYSFTVELKAMICDTPQRADCKGVKGHTGFNACERCEVKGKSIGGTVCFPELDATARSDGTWASYSTKNDFVSKH